jgi:hypothetical protein
MDKARLSPLWEVITTCAKGYFDALTNAALLVVLMGLDRYGHKGLGPIITIGALLLVAMLGARCWQVAEGLRPRIGAWPAGLVCAGMLALMFLPVLGGLPAALELLAKR